ncbi:lipoate--protein ligase [Paenibacillus radicis (ex Gao et al. 2016)]|uniref:lipoate--protein ligase n=1 Tax=Paenibacillus radicis (ex Gao et al. 2016) TaxID=1737354 RepID=A0A917LSW3_9BACL|nr:lipoate--protein ligase [Paenibacillus radicis (ex Gao et al. 2016)]GGG55921.1 lipoate--protein ligase [Paenibacillus radicis (ex Gao et al. 2016)]
MRFISNKGITDPTLNLALEEYVLRSLPDDDDYLLFYINEPSIIIGKNQNTVEEINADYVKDNSIHVVRRLSGGGAVYHDLGNLNFSFIMKDDGQSFHNFKKFTEPVVRALRKLGVEAELTGRNDLQVGERKISGNAQFSTKGKMFSHGTLLFDSEIENVVSALKVNKEKYVSKSTKSIRSRVANISEFLSEPITIEQFRQSILASIFEDEQEIPFYELTEQDEANVRKLAEERYRSWEWNYGRSPAFNMRQTKRIEGAGTFDVRLQVEEGVIVGASVYGDFFGRGDSSEFADKLVGVRYDADALKAILSETDLPYYFGAVTPEQWLELLI